MYKIIAFILLCFLFVGCNPASINQYKYNNDSAPLTIVAFGNTQGYNIMSENEYHEENPFHVINDLSLEPDIFLFAAEGVFSLKSSLSNCKRYRLQSKFISPPDFLNFIPEGKFTITSLANNHVLDCDTQGLVQTMNNFKEHKILTVGAGENTIEACKPLMLKIKGYDLAVLGYLDIYHNQFYSDTKKQGLHQ
jgi:hypothetical protein